MEYIYFARPDSIIHGVNVHTARKRMGCLLAKRTASWCWYRDRRSQFIFISSFQVLPKKLDYHMKWAWSRVNMWLELLSSRPKSYVSGGKIKALSCSGVVEGKKVAIIDDSIVRGTTSKQIVKLLKEAGAKEVHMRIASPPLRFPCFYGIDISTRAELIAADHSVQEICGGDRCWLSLGFLSTESLIKAIDIPSGRKVENGGLTVAYFDGKYPTPLVWLWSRLFSLTQATRRKEFFAMSRYQEAGVDVNAGYEMVKKIKQDVASTARLGC